MDTELVKLLVINLPNFLGLVALAGVLWRILYMQLTAMRDRIVYLEKMLTSCLEGKFDESPRSN